MSIWKNRQADGASYSFFNYWQKRGVSIIPNHFYQPIPDLNSLKPEIFSRKSKLNGIEINEKVQINYLKTIFPKYRKEYLEFSSITKKIDPQTDPCFYFENLAFDGVDALVYYCMIRHFHPKLVIEVGSGWSTKIAATAAIKNQTTRLESIEPYPQKILKDGFGGFSKLNEKKVQDVDLKYFRRLEKNDILFIDSTHTVKTGGDVNFLFFEVLPILKKGVIIHIHDIFLPYEYPKEWIVGRNTFWSEQYLLQAFLTYNKHFEILYSNAMMWSDHRNIVKKVFTNTKALRGGSIWLRKIK